MYDFGFDKFLLTDFFQSASFSSKALVRTFAEFRISLIYDTNEQKTCQSKYVKSLMLCSY